MFSWKRRMELNDHMIRRNGSQCIHLGYVADKSKSFCRHHNLWRWPLAIQWRALRMCTKKASFITKCARRCCLRRGWHRDYRRPHSIEAVRNSCPDTLLQSSKVWIQYFNWNQSISIAFKIAPIFCLSIKGRTLSVHGKTNSFFWALLLGRHIFAQCPWQKRMETAILCGDFAILIEFLVVVFIEELEFCQPRTSLHQCRPFKSHPNFDIHHLFVLLLILLAVESVAGIYGHGLV